MSFTNSLCEIAGIIAADGCLQKGYICVWSNMYEEKDYINKVVVPLFEKQFNRKLNPHEKASNSVYGFYMCGEELVRNISNYLGYPIGNKKYIVKVPKFIFDSKNEDYYTSFIRGYFDGDGSLSFYNRKGGTYSKRAKTYHYYPRLTIVSASKNIITQISDMLKVIGINCTIRLRTSKDNDTIHVLEIRGIERFEKWAKIIGFNNPVHKTKYDIWKKYGFLPPKTNIQQRKAILNDKININSFYGPVAQLG